jgi:sortase A
MNVVIRRTAIRLVLRWAQRSLFACAIVMLGYCAFVQVDTWRFQYRGGQSLKQQIQTTPAATREAVPAIGADGLIGRIEIARLDVSVIVVEGTANATLRRAAGHIEGTVLPGQIGNLGIAAHRDTFFRPLRNIHANDIITLTTRGGEYRYRVVSTKIVNPTDVAVLKSDGTEILTLVTCYPFYFVGAAPKRFIVRAERVTG